MLGEDEELLSIPLPFFSERFSPLGSPNAVARSACPKLRKSLSETSDDVRDIPEELTQFSGDEVVSSFASCISLASLISPTTTSVPSGKSVFLSAFTAMATCTFANRTNPNRRDTPVDRWYITRAPSTWPHLEKNSTKSLSFVSRVHRQRKFPFLQTLRLFQ